MPGDLTNIFGTGSKPVSYSKDTRIGALQGIFNDNEEFKKRQEEEKKRKEDEDRQREAEQKVRDANDKVSKVGVKEVVKELPGAVHKLFNAKNIIPFIEGAQRGALGMLSSTGTFMSQQLKTHPIPQLFKEQADSIAGKIESGSEALDEASALLFEPDTRGTMDKLTDPAYIARGVGDTVTRMLPSLLTGGLTSAATGSTALATVVSSATFAPQIYGDSFKEAKANGLSDEVANEKASVDTLAQAILESFGFSKLFGKSKIPTADFVKRASRRMLELTATEVLTENLQNVAAVMIGKDFGEDKDIQDAIEQIPETTLLTLVTSAFMGGAGEVVVGRNTDTGLVATQEPPKTIPFVDMEQPEPIVPPRREILTPERLAQIEEPITETKAVEASPVKQEVTTTGVKVDENLLFQEARKYKTAEEFVKAQGTPVYHGTNAKFEVFDPKKIGSATDDGMWGKGFYFGNTESFARVAPRGTLAKNVMEVYPKSRNFFDVSKVKSVDEMAKVLDMSPDSFVQETSGLIRPLQQAVPSFTSKVQGLGYDGVVVKRGGDAIETVIFDPKNIQTKSQLIDIYNQATQQVEQKKVTKGNMESRVYARLKEEHSEVLNDDVSYDAINLKKDAQKAVALINKDPAKGYKVAMGMQKPPVGQTATGINIAMAEKALEEGNTTLYSQLVKKRSLDQTRRGQEIVAEKGSVTDNSTSRYVKELISIKLDSLGNKYMSQATDKVTKRSNKIRAMEVLDKEVAKAQKKISGKMLDIKQAQSFLDALSC